MNFLTLIYDPAFVSLCIQFCVGASFNMKQFNLLKKAFPIPHKQYKIKLLNRDIACFNKTESLNIPKQSLSLNKKHFS